MVRTQIQLTEEQARTVRQIAKSRHLSVAELIRQAIDTLIKSNIVMDIEERQKRAMAVAGRFSSGKKDISKDHDRYLAEAFKK